MSGPGGMLSGLSQVVYFWGGPSRRRENRAAKGLFAEPWNLASGGKGKLKGKNRVLLAMGRLVLVVSPRTAGGRMGKNCNECPRRGGKEKKPEFSKETTQHR